MKNLIREKMRQEVDSAYLQHLRNTIYSRSFDRGVNYTLLTEFIHDDMSLSITYTLLKLDLT